MTALKDNSQGLYLCYIANLTQIRISYFHQYCNADSLLKKKKIKKIKSMY